MKVIYTATYWCALEDLLCHLNRSTVCSEVIEPLKEDEMWKYRYVERDQDIATAQKIDLCEYDTGMLHTFGNLAQKV